MGRIGKKIILRVALELGWLMWAVWILGFVRAVVESIGFWTFAVERVSPVTALVILTGQ